MIFTHCPDCGAVLGQKEIGDEGRVPYCSRCARPWFSFSYPCVICLVLDENDNIALIRQNDVCDRFICVSGFVKQGETIESTARREVEEEIGLKAMDVKYISSYYYRKHDDLMLGFAVRVKHSDFTLSCEVDSARWFAIEQAGELLRQGSVGKELLEDYLNSRR